MRFSLLTFVTLALSLTFSLSHLSLMKSWHESDTVLDPKLFKLMLLIPSHETAPALPELAFNKNFVQNHFFDDRVAVNDLVGDMLEDFFKKGGLSSGAHVKSDFEDVTKVYKRWVIEAREKNDKIPKINLYQNGKKISTFKHKGIFDCLNVRNPELGVKISRKANGKTEFKINGAELILEKEAFEKVRPFFKDVCMLVEYSKLQYNDFKKNMLAFHFESFPLVQASEYKDLLMEFFNKALESVKQRLEKVFGNGLVEFMVSHFAQAPKANLPSDRHLRVLETAGADTGNSSDPQSADHAKTIKYVMSIAFIFLYGYTCIYLYDMEVYRDSLVYSKFLSAKKK